MMSLSNDCLRYAGNKKDCPVSQNGKTYRVINKSDATLYVYEVDPCLIPDILQRKCDYLILAEMSDKKKALFVELKGADLTGAIKQVENSIKLLGGLMKGYHIFGRIVGRRVTPDIKSRRAFLDEKLRQLGGNLQIASTLQFSEEI